jgi:hypothetical protein
LLPRTNNPIRIRIGRIHRVIERFKFARNSLDREKIPTDKSGIIVDNRHGTRRDGAA